MKRLSSNMRMSMLFLLLSISTGLLSKNKPWTFLTYFAGANNLEPYVYSDLAEMMKIGSNDNVNIIAYATTQAEGGPKETRRYYVENGALVQDGPTTAMDSGSADTLKEALEWAETSYPAEHLAVVLWNHGSGPLNRKKIVEELRGICYDDETGNYLTDRDCLEAFRYGKDKLRAGKKYDIIACDACLMAGLEVAYTFIPVADYFVASQETIPGDGYEYARVLDDLAAGYIKPRDFAISMVGAYDEEYESLKDYTLSAVDLAALEPVVSYLNDMSRILEKLLRSKYRKKVKKYIKKSVHYRRCPCFDDGIYIDLGTLYNNVNKYARKMKLRSKDRKALQRAIRYGYNALRNAVIANEYSKEYGKLFGLSIYFPAKRKVDSSYYDLYWSEHTDWLSFIDRYVRS